MAAIAFILLVVAGNETTRNAITHGMNAFFENPEQWELFKEKRPESAVDEVIRVATRRWRKQPHRPRTWHEMFTFVRSLRERSFDRVIDTQGLARSALLAALARGHRHGGGVEHILVGHHLEAQAVERIGSIGEQFPQEHLAVPPGESFDRVLSLAADALAARLPEARSQRGLSGRGRWQRVVQQYETHRRNGVLPANPVIIDARYRNLGAAKLSGYDAAISYRRDTGIGELRAALRAAVHAARHPGRHSR